MAPNSQPVLSDAAAKAAGVSPGETPWMLAQAGRSAPLAQRLASIASTYQRQHSGLGLVQGGTLITAPTPADAAAAAEACAETFRTLPAPWHTVRLSARGGDALLETLGLIPVSGVLAAGRAAGLCPGDRSGRTAPMVPLVLWILITFGSIGYLAMESVPGPDLAPGWRLVCVALAIALLCAALRWVRRRRESVQMGRCLEAIRQGPEPERLQAFARALASPALVALPKPVAIVIEGPCRLDALSLNILAQMRKASEPAAMGVVHWVVFSGEGQDTAAARTLVGGEGARGAASVPGSEYVLVAGSTPAAAEGGRSS